jgi:hypothetical protein
MWFWMTNLLVFKETGAYFIYMYKGNFIFCSARSPQWLRGKWWTLKRHVPDYQNMALQGKDLCIF